MSTLSNYPVLNGVIVLTNKSYGNAKLAQALAGKTNESAGDPAERTRRRTSIHPSSFSGSVSLRIVCHQPGNGSQYGQLISTLQDIKHKRPTEIDTLNFAIVEMARSLHKEDGVKETRLLGELTKLKSELNR